MKEIYIKRLAQASQTISHELIVDCLNYYNVNGTKDLTENQIENYIKKLQKEGRM